MTVTLAQLLGGNRAEGSVEITGLTVDSRAVQKGDMFVALPGVTFDGRDYIGDAIKAGAVAVLTTPDVDLDCAAVAVVESINPRRRYAELAASFFGKQPETQVAVTGTNGKTSVAEFTRQLWQLLGCNAASVGTLGVKSARYQLPGGLTTPDPMALHRALHVLAETDVNHVAIEASSHGLDQYRLDGARFKAAAFTNLSRDHLDYHKSEQSYFYAKARLFGELLSPGDTAVINIDGAWGGVLDDIAWGRGLNKITVGSAEKADLRIVEQQPALTGQVVHFSFGGDDYSVELPLVGDFQAGNALLAAGLVIATGGDAGRCFAELKNLVGVPGRMEFIGKSAVGGAVYVDYAHTPDGLATVLKAARAHNPNKLHVLFGCGGDRDKGKRPLMGAAAVELADCAYITDDNPRSEDAAQIRQEIMIAAHGASEMPDRGKAIEQAISELGAGDMLIVAGKGHEEGQIVGSEILPFSDIEMVKAILANGG